jgi:hypothetical protein
VLVFESTEVNDAPLDARHLLAICGKRVDLALETNRFEPDQRILRTRGDSRKIRRSVAIRYCV